MVVSVIVFGVNLFLCGVDFILYVCCVELSKNIIFGGDDVFLLFIRGDILIIYDVI